MNASAPAAVVLIVLSLLATLVAYWIVSSRERSWVHVLTPHLLLFVPANHLLEFLHIHYFDTSASLFAYAFCFLAYGLSTLAFALAYAFLRAPEASLPRLAMGRSVAAPAYGLLLAAYALYAPVLLEFSDLLLEPREIYKLTRTGYGVHFFGSTVLMNFAFVLILYKPRAFPLEKVLVGLACVLLALLHGSKGQVVTLALVALLYQVYVAGWRPGLAQLAAYGAGFAGAMVGLFALTLTHVEPADILKGIASYSDYTRNAMVVVDTDDSPRWGALTAEENVFTRVPRALYPEKPKNFGSFALAERFYPDWFEADTGSPAFGVGVAYADFGYLALLLLPLGASVAGYLARIVRQGLARSSSPAYFVALCFFAGMTLVPVGAGYLLPEHLLLGILVTLATRITLGVGRRFPTGDGHPA